MVVCLPVLCNTARCPVAWLRASGAGTNRQPSHGPRTSASLLPSGSGREKRAGSIPSSGRCFVPLMPPWGEWGHLIVNAPFTPRSRFLSEAGVEGQPGRPQVASMFALLPLPLLTPDPLDSRWVVSQRMLQTPCRTPSLPISCSRACSASSPPPSYLVLPAFSTTLLFCASHTSR